MRILITGGSGFVGQALCKQLAQKGHSLFVVSRSPQQAKKVLPAGTKAEREASSFADAAPEALINLAGEPIADGRWTASRKQEIVDSRLNSTRALVDLCEKLETKPSVLVSASAMGFYGAQGDQEVTEDTQPHDEFAHRVCAAWEDEAKKAESHGVRVAIARIGLVLHPDGGMLKRVLTPFKLGVGGRLGDGKQYMPWITREDMVRVLIYLLEHEDASGPFNASAPNPVTNAEFTAKLARALNRPAVLPAPAAALKLAFGEMSRLLLTGANMQPERLLNAGFEFQHEQLDPALKDLLED